MEAYEKEQILYTEITNLIEHTCMENEITYCQILGVLDAVKDDYMMEFKMNALIGDDLDEDE